MDESGNRLSVLFVDDEPGIRLTLAAILRQSGFEVTAAATVSEALHEINTQDFDALVSDLNIGEPGDGFTVVSAMRRTQPACINFILTGYPAFDTALQAIRNQVDDYLVKPANVQELVASLQDKLRSPRSIRSIQAKSLASFLRDHASEIFRISCLASTSETALASVVLSEVERADFVSELISETVRQLESGSPDEPTEALLAAGAVHGEACRKQGYSLEMLVDEIRLLENAMYEIIQSELLKIELSTLVPNLRQVNSAFVCYLLESLKAFNMGRAA